MQAMEFAILMEPPCRKWICTYFLMFVLCYFCNIDMYIFDKNKRTLLYLLHGTYVIGYRHMLHLLALFVLEHNRWLPFVE